MADPRCLPLIEIDPGRVRAVVFSLMEGARTAEVVRVEEGLVNSLYRVTSTDGESLCVRICAAGSAAWRREQQILALAAATLPVPDVLLGDSNDPRIGHPYFVYRWIDGETVNECRRHTPEALLSLARPLGCLLGAVGSLAPSSDRAVLSRRSVNTQLALAERRLQGELARQRLGGALSDALRRRLDAGRRRLEALDGEAWLVHGDFGGRNILVRFDEGSWRVAGLLDWEEACTGSRLWDVGSLFRYASRYSATFSNCFSAGYREACDELPEDWYPAARLLDALRLVDTLNGERELPVVFSECRELVAAVVG